MCGDDLIIPNKEDITNTADKFMNFFKPPGLDDYTFVEVPDDDPAGCWTAKAFSSPAATLSSSGSLLAACLAASALLLLR
jgi:hypothetical protein